MALRHTQDSAQDYSVIFIFFYLSFDLKISLNDYFRDYMVGGI